MADVFKRTKIVCTIGPSSWPVPVLTKMVEAGMNVARLNGAFADVAELDRVAKLVRSISPDVALLLDIKGHEVRLNKFSEDIAVEPGKEIIIGSTDKDPIYPITYPELYKEITAGQLILIDKGETKLVLKRIEDGKIYASVVNGTVIKGGKGMNFPGAKLSNPALTPRDIEQIAFCVKDNWEFVAASFVRNAEDVRTVRKHLEGSSTRLISKIEDQQGADNFDEILKESDGIMVARGDMGAEIPIERLPILQKEFIYKCNQAAKPVITATNMLESMIEKPLPTRAEITDVANAVLDGTDALMTSGETSGGKYPLESVETMSKIAVENEKYLLPDIMDALQLDDHYVGVAMANAAFQVAENIELDKILVVSVSGTSARLLARHNLHMPILAFVSNPLFKNQLAMTKGIKAFVFPESYSDRDSALHGIITFALEQKLIDKTDKILLVGRGPKSGEDKHYFPNIFEYVELSKF